MAVRGHSEILSDLLPAEGKNPANLFLRPHLKERAYDRYHSTAHQAATVATMANVKRLLIGHFSSKYEEIGPFEQEAKEVFAHTELALEGVTYLIK